MGLYLAHACLPVMVMTRVIPFIVHSARDCCGVVLFFIVCERMTVVLRECSRDFVFCWFFYKVKNKVLFNVKMVYRLHPAF